MAQALGFGTCLTHLVDDLLQLLVRRSRLDLVGLVVGQKRQSRSVLFRVKDAKADRVCLEQRLTVKCKLH